MEAFQMHTVAQLHQRLGLPPPAHPLVSVIDFATIRCFDDPRLTAVTYGFYCVALKKNFRGRMTYGQSPYPHDHGLMSFFAPGQVVATEIRNDWELEGRWLVVHPNFLEGFPLHDSMRHLGLFSYATDRPLYLDAGAEDTVTDLLARVATELDGPPDASSRAIVIGYLGLLLNYCHRFSRRQFKLRTVDPASLPARFETLLRDYFQDGHAEAHGTPAVGYFADRLHLSKNYLSDTLYERTGRRAQDHIRDALVAEARQLLTYTELTVAQIAYRLGFGYPQSFHKLFKRATGVTPSAYRRRFLAGSVARGS